MIDLEGWLLGAPGSPITGVAFRNLRAGGRRVTSLADVHIRTGAGTTEVTFTP